MDSIRSQPIINDGDTTAGADRELRLGEVMLARRSIRDDEVEEILRFQAETGLAFGDAALTLGLVSETELKQALAHQRGYPRIEPNSFALASGSLVAARYPFCPQADALREIRTRIKELWLDGGHKSLAIVGAQRNAGRSHVVANLGVSFAQLGLSTLVVDADLRHPALHRIFGVGNRTGLETVLSRREGMQLHRMKEVAELWVLPAGPPPIDPFQLLSSDRFGSLIESLEKRFEVILFDTSARADCRDGEIVARRTGSALFVVRGHRSNADTELRCVNQFAQIGISVLGAVFNAA